MRAVYVLQALGAVLFALPLLIATLISYAKIRAASGTWLESHFRRQIRRFWSCCGWFAVFTSLAWIALAVAPRALSSAEMLGGLGVLWLAFNLISDSVQGWLRLRAGKAV